MRMCIYGVGLFLLAALCSPGRGQDCGTWTQTDVSGPSARANHAVAYDSERDRLILFGGTDDGGNGSGAKQDTWAWKDGAWTPLATDGPPPRSGHTMVYDAARDRVVLFGGWNGDYLADTWEWDGSAWHLRAGGGPSPRESQVMVYDPARGVTLMFGGAGSEGSMGDFWQWDGETWSYLNTKVPPGRFAAVMAYDLSRSVAVLFGGYDGEYRDDTWEWDGQVWNLAANNGSTPREGSAMDFDSVRNRCVLFGGSTGPGSFSDQTWEWNGSAWTLRSEVGPSRRNSASLTYDSGSSEFVLFGGYGDPGGFEQDTWTLKFTSGPDISVPPQDTSVEAHDPIILSVESNGQGTLTYQWRKDTIDLDNGGNIFGARDSTLTVFPSHLAPKMLPPTAPSICSTSWCS